MIWNGEIKRDVVLDHDGSFTGNNVKTWITPYYRHLLSSNC